MPPLAGESAIRKQSKYFLREIDLPGNLPRNSQHRLLEDLHRQRLTKHDV